jgi:uncharacterized membrane protein YeiH
VTNDFVLPIALDLSAITVFAISGAAAAVKRGYDIIGVLSLALVTALGGALLRDALFLQVGPPAFVRDGRYLLAVGVGALAVVPFLKIVHRLETPLLTIDALGLAVYTAVGAHKASQAGISVPGIILVGVINGVGGSIIRDVLTRHEPLLFKPGQYYAGAAILGAAVFVAFEETGKPPLVCAMASIAMTFGLRMAAVKFNWRTSRLGTDVHHDSGRDL